jgi:GC-rich sequence DNA-binding factor
VRRYDALFDYGVGQDPSAADPDDPDGELLPHLVRKLILPVALHLLRK